MSRSARRTPESREASRGFNADTSLSAILDEVIPWVAKQIEAGQIDAGMFCLSSPLAQVIMGEPFPALMCKSW